MAITINGDSGISGVDGSAATPALQGTDSNTGISFGTDEVNINTGGTTRVKVDSSGRVGIGTSPTSAGSRNTLTVNGATGSDFYLKHNGTEVLSIQCTSSSAAALNYPSSGNFYINRAGTGVAEFDGSGNLRFNSGYGSVATAYGCRAWVNFNGQGTVAINGSGNVSSISDNGTGSYQMNFTNSMPDANYALVGTANDNVGMITTYAGTYSSTTARIDSRRSDTGAATDWSRITAAVFR